VSWEFHNNINIFYLLVILCEDAEVGRELFLIYKFFFDICMDCWGTLQDRSVSWIRTL